MNISEFDRFLARFGCDTANFDYNDYRVKGDLYIRGKIEPEQLLFFDSIVFVDGEIFFDKVDLIELGGFNNLEKVGSLRISNCENLMYVTGFQNLKEVDKIIIENNLSLIKIYGFSNLFENDEEIEQIKITNNFNLENIDFLYGLKSTKSSLYLHHNKIGSLYGLSLLESVGASLSLSSNNIENLSFLSSLRKVNGMLGLVNNKIKDLSGLENLSSLKTVKWNGAYRTLAIDKNENLIGISALSNVRVMSECIIICDDANQFEITPSSSSVFWENNIIFISKKTSVEKYIGDRVVEVDFLKQINTADEFFNLSNYSVLGGYLSVRECKFIIININSSSPELFWINTKKYKYHYVFFRDVLKKTITLKEFDDITYFEKNKSNISGTLTYHDNSISSNNLNYGISFWPSDEININQIRLCCELMFKSFGNMVDNSFLHVAGSYLEKQVKKESFGKYIDLVYTDELFKKANFIPMNSGVTYGWLRFPSDENVNSDDIVILRELPNHISHVSGIITSRPQTPLSHINLIANQNNIPNCYLKEAHLISRFLELKDKYVRLEVTNRDVYITLSENDLDINIGLYEKRQIDIYNLKDRTIKNIKDISLSDQTTYGAKSSNLGEIYHHLNGASTPDAFAIPFFYYEQFMIFNDLYGFISSTMSDYHKIDNRSIKLEIIKIIKKKIKQAAIPEWMLDALKNLVDEYPEGTVLRCRSSASSEDIADFSGAGLYDSYSHKNKNISIAESIKKVWASVWNYRAVEERIVHGINHFDTLMGVCVHPRYKEEKANGVAVTKNIINEKEDGFYINVQCGEALVTNPGEGSSPEEISIIKNKSGYSIHYLRKSNLIPGDERIISGRILDDLLHALECVKDHYNNLGKRYAMEIEFKITKEGELHVKQLRPWISSKKI